jgi:hypothetical protein
MNLDITPAYAVDDLRFGSLTVQPIDVEWDRDGEDIDADDTHTWAEAFDYIDHSGYTWRLLATDGSVSHVYIGDKAYASHEYDDAAADWSEDNDGADFIDEREWDDLFGLGYGDVPDGPAMNYFYECHVADLNDTPRLVADLNVCVVELDGMTGFALTGGGMDLTWDIVAAYTRVGQLPPVHYAKDLPAMAGISAERPAYRYLIEASVRALTAQAEVMAHAAQRVRERFGV